MSDIFVSYNQADRRWAEWIAWQLEAAGYDVVLQAWDFLPGENFVLDMQRAVSEARHILAVLSPNYLEALYTQPEWAAGFGPDPTGEARRLIPVRVLDCKPAGLLANVIYIDLVGRQEADAREALLAGMQEDGKPATPVPFPGVEVSPDAAHKPEYPGQPSPRQAPPPSRAAGSVTTIPPKLPVHYQERTSELEILKKALLAAPQTMLPVTGAGAAGLRGMGGSGKTVLAAATAWDPDVRTALPDGVLWIRVGRERREKERFELLLELASVMGVPVLGVSSIPQARDRIREHLAERQLLLVLDDVWSREDAEALDVIGPKSRLLLTTRDAAVTSALGIRDEIRIEDLKENEALALLGAWAGQNPSQLPVLAGKVAEECGFLPLALAMAGALARKLGGWEDVLESFRRADLERLEALFPGYDYPNLLRALEVSAEALGPENRERYLELAIFPDSTAFPIATVEVLWSASGLSPRDSRELIATLIERSLLARTTQERLTLHDLQRDYLRKGAGDLRALHHRLVEAYAARCPKGPASAPNDGWYFQRLPWHLSQAGREDDLRSLLLSLPWLEAKLAATNVNSLIGDFDHLSTDAEARRLQATLRLSAHILADHPSQLQEQLLARLGTEDVSPGLRAVLSPDRPRTRPWLRPLHQFLSPPGPLLRTLPAHSGWVLAVAAIDSRRVLSIGNDRLLHIWDLESGEILRTWSDPFEEETAIAIFPPRQTATADWHGSVRVWDLENGETHKILQGHTGPVRALLWIDARRLVSASEDETLRLWDVESGETLLVLRGHSGSVNALALLDSSRLVSASDDRTLRIWDLDDGTCLQTLRGHADEILALDRVDRHSVVSGSRDGTMRLWDAEEGLCRNVVALGVGIVGLVRLDDRRVVAACRGGTLQVRNLLDGRCEAELSGHTHPLRAVVRLDGERLVSASEDGTLRVWNLAETSPVSQEQTAAVRSLAVLDDHRVISSAQDGVLRIWKVGTGEVLQILGEPGSPSSIVAVLSPGMVITARRPSFYVWDIDRGVIVSKLGSYRGAVNGLAMFGADRFVSANKDGILRLWNRKELLRSMKRKEEVPIDSVALVSSNQVISGHGDGALCIWDLETGNCILILRGHDKPVLAVVALDTSIAASGSEDGTVCVWNLKEGKRLARLSGHSGSVTTVTFWGARRVVSGSSDRTVRVWDVQSGELLALFVFDAPIQALAALPDGRTLAVGPSQGGVSFLVLEETES